MELTYKIRGADGKEYGPVSLNQLTTWLKEGRITPQSEVTRSDIDYWSPAANFTELQGIGSVAPQAMPPPVTMASTSTHEDPATVAQLKSGAGWFYWIAALTLVNAIAAVSGSDWRFILGVGISHIISGVGEEFEGSGKIIAFVLNLVVVAVLVGFGIFSGKRHTWAFVVGMALFALDAVIVLIASDWIGVAFHAFVLFCLFRGFQACRELNG